MQTETNYSEIDSYLQGRLNLPHDVKIFVWYHTFTGNSITASVPHAGLRTWSKPLDLVSLLQQSKDT